MPARFAKVTKDLFRGGCPSLKDNDIESLKRMGINKIVSLDEECGERIKEKCNELGIHQIIWGLGAGNDPKVAALKKRIVPTLTHGGPTYVHCLHGKDRTGMTVAMYRVYSGWSVDKALKEAAQFGMGTHLPPDVAKTYYDAVKEFAKDLEEDKSNALDAVSLTRMTNSFGPENPAVDDMTISRPVNFNLPPGTDIEFSQLSRIASAKIYIKCNSGDLLKPGSFWWGSKELANKNPINSSGKLFSANLKSSSKFEKFDGKVNKNLINNVLTRDIDVAILRDNQYLIICPSSLIDIQEENDDINDLVEVGMRDNSTDYTYAYPGSGSGLGGMPDGAAGFVQLPFSGIGQV
jgi:hypothetical protein